MSTTVLASLPSPRRVYKVSSLVLSVALIRPEELWLASPRSWLIASLVIKARTLAIAALTAPLVMSLVEPSAGDESGVSHFPSNLVDEFFVKYCPAEPPANLFAKASTFSKFSSTPST